MLKKINDAIGKGIDKAIEYTPLTIVCLILFMLFLAFWTAKKENEGCVRWEKRIVPVTTYINNAPVTTQQKRRVCVKWEE